ncbi:MAG: hypothetical protein FWG25_08520 [Promicromonosporaceae bacterium]|nr:hypothetical protein [Promicromonosporaceae bacterium]
MNNPKRECRNILEHPDARDASHLVVWLLEAPRTFEELVELRKPILMAYAIEDDIPVPEHYSVNDITHHALTFPNYRTYMSVIFDLRHLMECDAITLSFNQGKFSIERRKGA